VTASEEVKDRESDEQAMMRVVEEQGSHSCEGAPPPDRGVDWGGRKDLMALSTPNPL
jgi:hypothetical protein